MTGYPAIFERMICALALVQAVCFEPHNLIVPHSLQPIPVELDALRTRAANVDCLVAASMVAFS